MSNRQLDAYLAHEHMLGEIACVECGYHRSGAHHPKIRCPQTGRCGECGNDWPCPDHQPRAVTKKAAEKPETCTCGDDPDGPACSFCRRLADQAAQNEILENGY